MIMLHSTEKCPFDSEVKKFGESIPGQYQQKLGCGGVMNEEGMTNEGKVFPEHSVGAKIPGPFIFQAFFPSSRTKLCSESLWPHDSNKSTERSPILLYLQTFSVCRW